MTIVYHVKDINFSILIKCPICHSDLFDKTKRIENREECIILHEEFKKGNNEYIQTCPNCSFIFHYVNCIENKKSEIISISEKKTKKLDISSKM